MFNRLHIALSAGALLLSMCATAHADDVQDANKLFKQGQHIQALEKVERVLADHPKDAQARFLKGLILTEQNLPNDAVKAFYGLTEDYPELPEPYNNLAVLYASLGQYDKAKIALEMAIRTHPSYATAHENLGDIYAKMASQAYDRAFQLDRSNTATQTKLAMIHDLFSASAAPKAIVTRNAATGIVNTTKLSPPASQPVQVATAHVTTAQPAQLAVSQPASAVAVTTRAAVVENVVSAALPADKGAEVLRSVHDWAAAWSARDVKKYLACYADDFRPADGTSRADWASSRQARIRAPKSIQVGISEAAVSFSDDSHASVHFRQSYRASHLHTSSRKTLMMVKTAGKWLILEERSK
jgi:tetratricopeptide (TPR) repeat protein